MLFNTMIRVQSYHILHTVNVRKVDVYRCCMAVVS